jgi:hypothetical protein
MLGEEEQVENAQNYAWLAGVSMPFLKPKYRDPYLNVALAY